MKSSLVSKVTLDITGEGLVDAKPSKVDAEVDEKIALSVDGGIETGAEIASIGIGSSFFRVIYCKTSLPKNHIFELLKCFLQSHYSYINLALDSISFRVFFIITPSTIDDSN